MGPAHDKTIWYGLEIGPFSTSPFFQRPVEVSHTLKNAPPHYSPVSHVKSGAEESSCTPVEVL